MKFKGSKGFLTYEKEKFNKDLFCSIATYTSTPAAIKSFQTCGALVLDSDEKLLEELRSNFQGEDWQNLKVKCYEQTIGVEFHEGLATMDNLPQSGTTTVRDLMTKNQHADIFDGYEYLNTFFGEEKPTTVQYGSDIGK